MFLGYALGVIAIIRGPDRQHDAGAEVQVLDAMLVIVMLHVAGTPGGGDNAHLMHRLYGVGLTQRKIALLVYAICALFGYLATTLIRTEKLIALGALAVVIGALIFYVRFRGASSRLPA